MTYSEVCDCLSLLKVNYPKVYRDVSKKDAESLVKLWTACFADYEASIVQYALVALINTSPFAPTIADVKTYIQRMQDAASGTPSDGQMWSMLVRAVRNGYYGYKEEFEKLPDELKEYVGHPEQLRSWAQIDEAVFNSVHQSNFQKNFRIARQRAKDRKTLPPEIRNLLAKSTLPGDRLLPDDNDRRNEILDRLEDAT